MSFSVIFLIYNPFRFHRSTIIDLRLYFDLNLYSPYTDYFISFFIFSKSLFNFYDYISFLISQDPAPLPGSSVVSFVKAFTEDIKKIIKRL